MKTHCKKGHEYTPENKIRNGTSYKCKACSRERYVKKGYSPTPISERFWSKVDKAPGQGPNGECWEWQGTIVGFGYGQLRDEASVSRPAHRVSYELENGPIPSGLIVRHRCDNPACVNPSHLELGTYKDNSQDMAARGRTAGQKKTHCPTGHEYSPENTRIESGKRKCKTCARLLQQRRNAKNKTSCVAA